MAENSRSYTFNGILIVIGKLTAIYGGVAGWRGAARLWLGGQVKNVCLNCGKVIERFFIAYFGAGGANKQTFTGKGQRKWLCFLKQEWGLKTQLIKLKCNIGLFYKNHDFLS